MQMPTNQVLQGERRVMIDYRQKPREPSNVTIYKKPNCETEKQTQ